jgi:hypothetical protein
MAVFGIYPSSFDAECGAADLISAGFAAQDISVLLSDIRSERVRDTHAGGLLGGALGILAGVGTVVIPGMGAMVAAGPLLAALEGLGAAGGVPAGSGPAGSLGGGSVGGLMSALMRLGLPEHEAKRYEGGVRDGGALLSVHCDFATQIKRAKQVLNSAGANHVAASHESRSTPVELAIV